MSDHILTGKKGEEEAVRYLVKKGYKIKQRNWRFKVNEVDIIAEKDNFLVVVEVKTRTNPDFENPKEAVTKKKQRFIIKATDAYIQKYDIVMEVRFDIVAVTIQNNNVEIEHIEDAFQAYLL
ncbi:MAG: hypothetical protein A2X13_11505 [Bacteroidetes bacterium GWC2_33_15]|nr:MAG: hypothetical protein A2X10_05530 [Bacteroidetes bacterium GWA2_33_15]OFX50766.1 MAG: hypothetical protein A2X13_11505 [Bacteroidetes bacterium GWC2_33_15]OFX62952.1 MAG: hypothetical protein A2X15_09865 [Bacteroidetes bacterium GWB2_32_14]OFX70021.1 MAG: hypothetical protein A2X14_02725 [Bacteroidetes bacterium GWD2_33_33]HAN19020.1 YraN family protein [Bacteroidales bacterium]